MAETAIVAEDVCVERGAQCVLHGVNVCAEHGEILALLGPNGAGKSTLLRALTGLLPFRGEIRIDGVSIREIAPRERARRCTLVPQQTSLRSPLAVREIVAQGRYALRKAFGGLGTRDRERIDWAIETTDLGALAERPFTRLSCGEQRRTLIARSLATDARIVCLDEPAAALDIGHALELYALLRRLAREGYAIVLVLHQLDDALRHTDRALLLANGRCAGAGATSQVVTVDPVRDVYGVELVPGAGLGFRRLGETAS
jgi:iron complex transport system ATP-binding protein